MITPSLVMKFVAGTCVAMGGHAYRIKDASHGYYLMSQTVVVFEEDREFTELWKSSWIDSHATKVIGVRAERCRD